jgi:hypothetical protein
VAPRRVLEAVDPFGVVLQEKRPGKDGAVLLFDAHPSSGAAHLSVAFSNFGEVDEDDPDDDRMIIAAAAAPGLLRCSHRIDDARRTLAFAVDEVARALGRGAKLVEAAAVEAGWFFGHSAAGTSRPGEFASRDAARIALGAFGEIAGPFKTKAEAGTEAVRLLGGA